MGKLYLFYATADDTWPRSAPAATDRYFLPTGRSAANPPAAVAVVDRWDRQTDKRTLDRNAVTPLPRATGGLLLAVCLKMLPKCRQVIIRSITSLQSAIIT